MRFPYRFGWRRLAEAGALALVVVAVAARACGPDFPNRYLFAAEAELLAAPEGVFVEEIAAVAASLQPRHRAVVVSAEESVQCRREIERAQLCSVLENRGFSQQEAAAVYVAWQAGASPDETEFVEVGAPDAVPQEFQLYRRGAAAWHRRDFVAAKTAWQTLMALPEAERRFRTVWAEYMLGRLAARDLVRLGEPARVAWLETQRAFHAAREAAASGCPDPLGLAAASYGWEAKAALEARRPTVAIFFYLTQHAAGDPTAIVSLRLVCAKLEWDELAELAPDPMARRVLTAYLVCRGSLFEGDEARARFSSWAQRWALTLEQAKVATVPEADRLAWVAYQGGLFVLAERWTKLAPAEASMARWLEAKLALRAGQLREGVRLLGPLAGDGRLNAQQRRRVGAELGRASLALGDYVGALDAWLNGGHWTDAAYVAERAMTTDELQLFLKEREALPPGPAGVPTAGEEAGPGDPWMPADRLTSLRHLLGRRLARAGSLEAAEPFFPEELRPVLRGYAVGVKTGFDGQLPAGDRAAAFWHAAQVLRERGMDLLGTELDPDWRVWRGDFALPPAGEERRGVAALSGGVFAPRPEELSRLERHLVPERRYHYRFRAAELAWWAAALLPNDAEETARILDTAGRWIAARDPQEAKRFYQALVIRCGHTELGRAAAAKRWFPECR